MGLLFLILGVGLIANFAFILAYAVHIKRIYALLAVQASLIEREAAGGLKQAKLIAALSGAEEDPEPTQVRH